MNNLPSKTEYDKQKNAASARRKLIQSGLLALALLCELLFATFTYSWFSNSSNVTATGMQVAAAAAPTIDVNPLTPGSAPGASEEIIIVDVVPEVYTTDDTSDPTRMKKVSPDSYGYFSFDVTANVSSYNISAACNVKDADFKGTVDTAEEKAKHIDYLNSHVLFFKEYDETTGVFSGWVQPGDTTNIPVTPNVANRITLYWIWVSSYTDMSDGSEVISDADVTNIETFINDGHFNEFFDTRGDTAVTQTTGTAAGLLRRYYDHVDENIGSGIENFHVTVTFNV